MLLNNVLQWSKLNQLHYARHYTFLSSVMHMQWRENKQALIAVVTMTAATMLNKSMSTSHSIQISDPRRLKTNDRHAVVPSWYRGIRSEVLSIRGRHVELNTWVSSAFNWTCWPYCWTRRTRPDVYITKNIGRIQVSLWDAAKKADNRRLGRVYKRIHTQIQSKPSYVHFRGPHDYDPSIVATKRLGRPCWKRPTAV